MFTLVKVFITAWRRWSWSWWYANVSVSSYKLRNFSRKDGNQRGTDLIDLMIEAMEDNVSHDDDQDGGQFEEDAKLAHR